MGLVNFRSAKERTARYTRQTRNAARHQNLNQSLEYFELKEGAQAT